MSETSKIRHGKGWLFWLIPLALVDFILLIRYLIRGQNVALLNPKGLIADEQYGLLVLITALLLLASVPVVLLLYFIAWKYRESNAKAVHKPGARHGKLFVFAIWAFPTIFFLVFTMIMVPATHRLEPRKPVASGIKPLTIQVVSMRWKWLFLYPDQKVATVNYVKIPKDVPITFELTADEAPMSSFWIPNLGGQLYTMTGHVNKLNILADEVGDYRGSSAEINGAGFADMIFTASVSSQSDFDQWVNERKQSGTMLDATAYANLVKPSEKAPPVEYGDYQSDLYDTVLMKYKGSHEMHNTNQTHPEERE